jgi:4-carboxymuconolactone decarboxylase
MPVEEMDDAQRTVNDWLVAYLRPGQAGTGEALGGPMDALLHSPKLAELTGQMATLMFEQLSLPRKATEVVVLVTARHWNCNFEFHIHRRYAGKAGLDSAVVEAIETGVRPQLPPELDDAYEFAVQLLRHGDVSDDLFARIVDRWGRRGAVELVATVGYYSFLAFVLNVDRYPVPTESGGRLLPPLNASSAMPSWGPVEISNGRRDDQ